MPTEKSKSEIALEISIIILKVIGIIALALIGSVILIIVGIVYLLIWLSKEEAKTTAPIKEIEPRFDAKPLIETKSEQGALTPPTTYSYSGYSCPHGPDSHKCNGCGLCLDCVGRADGWCCNNCDGDDDEDD